MNVATQYRRTIFTEAHERIRDQRRYIETALQTLGHDPNACVLVEEALAWLIAQDSHTICPPPELH